MINLSEKSISYGKLLHQVIAHKAPPEFFEILLQQPGIDPNLKNDQGQTPAHSILEKILQSTSEESTSEGSGSDESTSDEYEKEEGTIYFQYLKYLLLEFHSKLEYCK